LIFHTLSNVGNGCALFLRDESDFEKLSYDVLVSLSKQNVKYAEIFFSPTHYETNGLSVGQVTNSVLKGASKAKKETKIKYNFIVDVCRNFGGEKAIQTIKSIEPYLNSGKIIGIGLGGSEAEYPPELFVDAFTYAKSLGLNVTAHAGEGDGPKSIFSAINLLGVNRIGHGVRCVEDENCLKFLKEKNIVLEVCLTSNLKTKIFKNANEHPIKLLLERKILVTVNSDDPTFFGTNLQEEYLRLWKEVGLEWHHLKVVNINAIDGSFLDRNKKDKLKAQFEVEFKSIEEKFGQK